jgi:murein DD-endopeptidase MepM/ murein hydrolase activator NlpD
LLSLTPLLAAALVAAPADADLAGPALPDEAPRLDGGGRVEPAVVPLAEPAPPPPTRSFPVDGDVTWGDGFGERVGGHDGVDVLARCGTPLRAVRAGRVVLRTTDGAAGRHLVLRAGGAEHVYMHLQDVAVAEGERVRAGDRLGTVGATGNATTCHLHFEAWRAPGWHRGAARDPEPMLRRLARRASTKG